eukprot:3654965-Rhodomonas_salina.1
MKTRQNKDQKRDPPPQKKKTDQGGAGGGQVGGRQGSRRPPPDAAPCPEFLPRASPAVSSPWLPAAEQRCGSCCCEGSGQRRERSCRTVETIPSCARVRAEVRGQRRTRDDGSAAVLLMHTACDMGSLSFGCFGPARPRCCLRGCVRDRGRLTLFAARVSAGLAPLVAVGP